MREPTSRRTSKTIEISDCVIRCRSEGAHPILLETKTRISQRHGSVYRYAQNGKLTDKGKIGTQFDRGTSTRLQARPQLYPQP